VNTRIASTSHPDHVGNGFSGGPVTTGSGVSRLCSVTDGDNGALSANSGSGFDGNDMDIR